MSATKNLVRLLGASACLTTTASLLLASLAQATPTWLPAQTLGAEAGISQAAAVPALGDGAAIAGDGAAAVAWSAQSRGVLLATRAPGAPFAPAVELLAQGSEPLAEPAVGVDGAGGATAVWVDPSAHDVEAATVQGGLAGGRQALSAGGLSYEAPRVAIDERGDVLAVWVRREGALSSTIEAAYQPAGGRFGPAVQLSPAGQAASAPSVAIDAAGEASIAWREPTAIEAASCSAAGSFSAPLTLASVAQPQAPDLAGNGAGAFAVVWGVAEGAGAVVQVATRPPGGAFSTAQTIASAPSGALAPQVGLDAAGEVTVAWQVHSPGAGHEILLASGPLSDPGASVGFAVPAARAPSLAVSAGGAAVLGYLDEYAGADVAAASYRPAGGSFEAQTIVSAPGEAVHASTAGERPPVLAGVDAEGDGLLAYDPLGVASTPAAALLDAAGPALNDLSIPASGTAGQPLSFSVAPADGVSAVASTSWSFGEGAVASGIEVTHAFAAPGTYSVSVTSVDAYGNASTTTRSIAIAPAPAPARRARARRRRRRRRHYAGALLVTHLAHATREGTFRLRVRCVAYTDCSGGHVWIAVLAKADGSTSSRRAGTARLGRDKFQAASHASASVSFWLTKRLLSLLRSHGTLALLAVVRTHDVRGQSATTRARVKLEAPRGGWRARRGLRAR
ncbi:MAG: PKD domain-containing protein [Solirubrobacteraceae bacterium]